MNHSGPTRHGVPGRPLLHHVQGHDPDRRELAFRQRGEQQCASIRFAGKISPHSTHVAIMVWTVPAFERRQSLAVRSSPMVGSPRVSRDRQGDTGQAPPPRLASPASRRAARAWPTRCARTCQDISLDVQCVGDGCWRSKADAWAPHLKTDQGRAAVALRASGCLDATISAGSGLATDARLHAMVEQTRGTFAAPPAGTLATVPCVPLMAQGRGFTGVQGRTVSPGTGVPAGQDSGHSYRARAARRCCGSCVPQARRRMPASRRGRRRSIASDTDQIRQRTMALLERDQGLLAFGAVDVEHEDAGLGPGRHGDVGIWSSPNQRSMSS